MGRFKAVFRSSDCDFNADFENVSTVTIEVEPSHDEHDLEPPIWTNAADITRIAKDPKAIGKTKTIVFPPQYGEYVETFDVPSDLVVYGVEVYSVMFRQFYDCHEEFTVSDVEHNGIAYRRYEDNRGYAAGERAIKVSWR